MASVFNVEKQLVFYGAYHTNKTNIAIHIVCVPLLIWTAQAIVASLPKPAFFPDLYYEITPYLAFDFHFPFLVCVVGYLSYYFALLPSAALTYAPLMILMNLTATSFVKNERPFDEHVMIAVGLNIASWLAQFVGHGVAEKRAPALLDNILGAFVLAPFFVHLEILFHFGFYPDLHKSIQVGVAKELSKLKQKESAKKKQ